MRQFFTWPTIFFAVVMVLCCSAAWACGDEPRPTYLWFFSASNCGPCRQMKTDIEATPSLRAAVAKFTVYKLDYDIEEHRPPFAAAGVRQFPTVVIYDHRKTEMRRLVGHPVAGGVERLRKFLEGQ